MDTNAASLSNFESLATVIVDAVQIPGSRRDGALRRALELLERLRSEFSEPLPPVILVNKFSRMGAAQTARRKAEAIAGQVVGPSRLVVAIWESHHGIYVAAVGSVPDLSLRQELARCFSVGVPAEDEVPDKIILGLYHGRSAISAG
jgi:hypothetical protein